MVAFDTLKQSVPNALFKTGSREKILLTQPQQDQCVISVQDPVRTRPGFLHTSASVTQAKRTTNHLHRERCGFHDKSVEYLSILTYVSVNATAQRFIFSLFVLQCGQFGHLSAFCSQFDFSRSTSCRGHRSFFTNTETFITANLKPKNFFMPNQA